MSNPIKVIAFAGSLRKASFNHVLAELVAQQAQNAGAQVEVIRLDDFSIPLFNEDLEKEGPIASVEQLKDKIRSADALIVASPEYNGSVSGVLKNALDWLSRTPAGELPAFSDTVVALVAASPGGLGGIRGLSQARDVFVGVGALVLSDQLAVANAYQAFDDQGQLTDEDTAKRVKDLAESLVVKTTKLNS